MTDNQRAALRELMNTQRHYILAATHCPDLVPDALQKLWCITSIIEDGMDIKLHTAAQIEKTDAEVAELNRMMVL
jgi:hypothetical protein